MRLDLIEPETNCSPTFLVRMHLVLQFDADLMDDEEEVLLALAEVLGSFLDYTGGPAHAIHIIKPLEKLCQVEETTVRDKVSIM